jgi:hypothetical protein
VRRLERLTWDYIPGVANDEAAPPVPIPAELHEAVTEGVLLVADLLQREAQRRQSFDDAYESVANMGHFEKLQAEDRAGFEAFNEQLRAATDQVQKAVSAVNDSFDATVWLDEEHQRACAAATCEPGAYAVVVSKVSTNDPHATEGITDIDYARYTVQPYLEGRLGYTWQGAEDAIARVRHVSPETVLEGVTLDDAVRIKEELVRLGCKAQVEGRPRSTAVEGGRQPIPESVRHEVWRRDQGRCVDCGSRERLEYDHIIPVSRGGSNTARNIELRCESCNRRKAASI